MARRFVDLSVPLETGIVSDPPIMLPEIEYLTHDQTAEQVMSFFPGFARDQPSGDGFAIACFPFKIKATSVGFTRAVAIFGD